MNETSASKPSDSVSIWWFALGYFSCYVPYSALTKAISKGLLPGKPAVKGFVLLPLSVLVSVIGMFTFITIMRWWKYPTRRKVLGVDLPTPTRWTFLSGLCTATIVATTTLAYTFKGISIVFIMLLMRGGVLIIAPVVDMVSRRKVRWFSWAGLILSFSALVVAFSERGGYHITLVALIDIVAYLGSYFVRLRFMSQKAKSADADANYRYFVEEQMVATPAVMLVLGLLAIIGYGDLMLAIREGFTDIIYSGVFWEVAVVGVMSQGTGIFGGLILLQKQENTFCVPVNRCSSIMAGVVASYVLTIWLGNPMPSYYQLVGAGLIIAAIVFLTVPTMFARKKKKAAPAPA